MASITSHIVDFTNFPALLFRLKTQYIHNCIAANYAKIQVAMTHNLACQWDQTQKTDRS